MSRGIVYHRRATKYLERMPRDRQEELLRILEEVSGLDDIAAHPGIKLMKGERKNWHRLRVGNYRAVLKVMVVRIDEILYVDYIGPRGDAY